VPVESRTRFRGRTVVVRSIGVRSNDGTRLAYQDRHADIFSKQDFLVEMAEKIWELDVVDLFGVAMIPAGFRRRTEDEVLLEKQDLDRRINTATARSRAVSAQPSISLRSGRFAPDIRLEETMTIEATP